HNTLYTGGLSATVGIEGPLPAPRPFNLYSFNTNSLVDGQCIEFSLPPACIPVPSGDITASTGTTNCEADVTVPVPTFDPLGCDANNGLRYSFDGGAFVVVPSGT
ncbi:hypothetical protein RZS08_61465, partial [Arthrospira platensis SPKY1]|nr:hypothetical protein [Arthrospira platensis SPKY1]